MNLRTLLLFIKILTISSTLMYWGCSKTGDNSTDSQNQPPAEGTIFENCLPEHEGLTEVSQYASTGWFELAWSVRTTYHANFESNATDTLRFSIILDDDPDGFTEPGEYVLTDEVLNGSDSTVKIELTVIDPDDNPTVYNVVPDTGTLTLTSTKDVGEDNIFAGCVDVELTSYETSENPACVGTFHYCWSQILETDNP
jgi:hypothetical protein